MYRVIQPLVFLLQSLYFHLLEMMTTKARSGGTFHCCSVLCLVHEEWNVEHDGRGSPLAWDCYASIAFPLPPSRFPDLVCVRGVKGSRLGTTAN